MNTKNSQQAIADILVLDSDRIALVILNIYATTSQHLYDYLSQGASISMPDPAYESALELFENTRLGGSVIWINAEGVTLDELAQLESHWLPEAGKAVMLIGNAQVPVINRSLQGLMAARRANALFQAVVLTPVDSIAATTCRLMASQSNGWLRHEVKDRTDPQGSIAKVMQSLDLHVTAELQNITAPELPAAIPRPAPLASATPLELPTAVPSGVAPTAVVQEISLGTTDRSAPSEAAPSTPIHPTFQGTPPMATLNDSMNACMQIDGAMAAALVDMSSGMALAKVGGGVNLDMAAAGNTEVLKAKLKTMASLGLKDTIEDVLITLGTQYHLIRPIPHKQGLFLYLVLDKTKGNLAMARFKLMAIEKDITV